MTRCGRQIMPGVVDAMYDGEWIVRGTLDPAEALGAVIGEWDGERDDSMFEGVSPETWRGGRFYGPLDLEAVQEMADWCHDMIASAESGWWRKVHCLPNSEGYDDGWTWQLLPAREGSRGAFRGVYFRS